MEELQQPQGEFHHFQLVNQDGEVPVSISVLVHYNQKFSKDDQSSDPITTDDIIEFHEALQGFDGDYMKAFKRK